MSDYGLSIGELRLASIGPIVFGPGNVLFIADNDAAILYAVDIDDREQRDEGRPVQAERLSSTLASVLGVERDEFFLRGMAVHPASKAVYLSVTRGAGASEAPALVRVDGDGVGIVDLTAVPFSSSVIADAPDVNDERLDGWLDGQHGESRKFEVDGMSLTFSRLPLRQSTVTDLAWIDGTVFIAGASNEEFSSTLRRVSFPFSAEVSSSSLEIFHVSHGKYETASPIKSLVVFDDGSSVLASYVCTPVVQFSVADLQPGAHVHGKTVAELGSMNQPLDMVSYRDGDEEYLLVSNTRHPLLKIPTRTIAGQPALTDPGEATGVPRSRVAVEGVSWMADTGDGYVLMIQDEDGELSLRAHDVASL